MTKTSIIAFCLAIALPSMAGAQVHEDTDYDFRARISAELDKKIVGGLHANISEEFRLKDNLSAVDRFYTTVGLTWKTCPYFKIGAAYTLMNLHKRADAGGWEWDLRHRATLDLTGMYNAGYFKFSLRERFQLTHRTGEMNIYQNPRNAFALRSRFKVAYVSPSKPIEPYVSVEVRNTLNNVHFDSPSFTVKQGDNVRYNDVYVNKVIKTNIVNDRGIHICKSMLAWLKWGNGETPETSSISSTLRIIIPPSTPMASTAFLERFSMTHSKSEAFILTIMSCSGKIFTIFTFLEVRRSI